MKDHQPLGHLSLMVMTMPIRKLWWLYIFNMLIMIYGYLLKMDQTNVLRLKWYNGS
jgi:hypothetical protein